MPPEIQNALPFSSMEQIDLNSHEVASLPERIFNPTLTKSWCYYFEKADLARQKKDWEEIVEIGDIAFQLDDSPNHASERVPFIEGYAHIGNWETAVELTMDAIKINSLMKNMLCDTWERIDQDLPESSSKTEAVRAVDARLLCNNE
jgi:hypothetical protein